MRWTMVRGAAAAACAAVVMAGSAQAAFDPAREAKNFSKTQERSTIFNSPAFQAELRTTNFQNGVDATTTQAADPERQFVGDLCWNRQDGCAGDVRLNHWGDRGYGIVQPVLFTARNGATLSGHIWSTKAGPAKKPGVVITNGSVQANEQLYWYAAQALAKAGYVVMTFDPQGQGQSDTPGEAPDQTEGVPAQSDGRPFFDGTQDALNFFFSTPSERYVPETSCSTGTSHAAKQDRRVAAGLDAAYNPYWDKLDPGRVGVAGHSYGAAGVSYVGQRDPRVKAIVAWDNLSQASPGTNSGGFPPGAAGCPAHPGERVNLNNAPAAKAKPALGLSADYFLPPTPNTSEPPTPEHCKQVADAFERGTPPSQADGTGCKSLASTIYSRRGIDTGEIVIRGGSHLDFSFIPNQAFGASLRGADLTDWYTTAWFDKYVKGDKTADARLLTNRWRHDPQEGAIDPDHDANMMSFYHPSRLDFHLAGGKRYTNEDLRGNASGLTDADGFCGTYSYVDIATTPDRASTDFASCAAVTKAGCLNSRFTIAGSRLGVSALGRRRKTQRRLIGGKLRSRRGGIDRYCIAGGGAMRIGYATTRLRKAKRLRAGVRKRGDRAILSLTSSKRFTLKKLKVGARESTVRKRLHGEKRYRVGRNRWYLVAGKKSRLLFQVRGGRLRQIGIASKALSKGAARAKPFLGGWHL